MAAQIRQYFATFNPSVITSGCRYFSGMGSLTALTCNQLSNPRGATVKALLINSGEPMSMYHNQNRATVQGSITLGDPPDMYQVSRVVIDFVYQTHYQFRGLVECPFEISCHIQELNRFFHYM